MSYPYTKPQSRYGFRRRWNEPNTGLVGSGPGRPMKTYFTDAEVGLPQRGPGLSGAAPVTGVAAPTTQGIFNIGPARGFSRGVFTPDPPWATPRYIANMPDGVDGLGGCLACGGLGQDADPCGLDKIKNIIVSKITSEIPTFTIDLELTELEINKSLTGPALKSLLDSIQATALNAIDAAAKSGISAVRTALKTYVTPLIVSVVKALLDKRCKDDDSVCKSQNTVASYTLSGVIDNAMQPLYGKVAAEIRLCMGFNDNEQFLENVKAQVALVQSAIKASGASSAQQDMLAFQANLPSYEVMAPVNLNKASIFDTSKFSTLASAQSKCISDGGAWYDGGAECDVDQYGQLYNCRAPSAGATKTYTCVPVSTPGATTSTGSSNLPLILGAGAAIVALLLLTR